MLGDEGPIERWHPVGDEVVFFDPRLVVVVVGRELNGGEVVYVAMGVPVAQGKFSGDWDVVLKLLELVVDVVLDVVCRWRWSPHNSGHVGGSTVVV